MNANTLPRYVLGTYKAAGQPVQLVNAFEEPVRAKSGLLAESVAKLKAHHEQIKTTWDMPCDTEVTIPDVIRHKEPNSRSTQTWASGP